MDNSLWVLVVSSASVAVVHALAPDHWMPFVALARAQRWSRLRLFWVTLISGIGHVGISVLFSMIGILLGFSLSRLQGVEGHRGEIALWLLIGFGIAYMLWGLKNAHSHRHEHIEEEVSHKKKVALWTFFAVFVLGPCEPLVPLVFLGYNYGFLGFFAVSIVFSLVTIAMMLGQTFLAYAGFRLIKSDIADRYSHAFAGLVIALTGVMVMFLGI